MITCFTTPSLHNSHAIFAQLSRSAFLTILEHGTGYIQSHTDFLYSLVCTVRYRNGLDARCILSASAIVLLGFIQLCGRLISHQWSPKRKLETATKFSIKVNISALLSLKNVWLLFCTFLKFMFTLAFPVFSRTSQEDKTKTTTTTNSLYGALSWTETVAVEL